MNSPAVNTFRADVLTSKSRDNRATGESAKLHEAYQYAAKRIAQRRLREFGYCTKCGTLREPFGTFMVDALVLDHLKVFLVCGGRWRCCEFDNTSLVASVHDIAVEMGYPNNGPRIAWRGL